MPKKPKELRRAVGIPEKVYLEMEDYAKEKNPQLFLYEVVVMAWENFKKSTQVITKKS